MPVSKFVAATLLPVALLSGQALAQDGDAAPAAPASAVQVHGKVWANYTYDMTKDSSHKNGFDIYRAFLQGDYKFNDTWSADLLLDAMRNPATATTPTTGTPAVSTAPKAPLDAYVRNAYIQGSNLWGEGSTFRFGLQPTMFINTMDNAIDTRWLGRSLLDQANLETSNDGAVYAGGSFTPLFQYGIMVHNGIEGLTAAGNNDSGLAYGVLLGSTLLGGEKGATNKLSVFLYGDAYDRGEVAPGTVDVTPGQLYAAGVTWASPMLDARVEYATAKSKTGSTTNTTSGYGVTANLKMDVYSLYARYFTGNDNFKTALGAKSMLSVGPTYSLIKDRLMTGLVYENDAAVASGANAAQSVSWNWAANF